MKNCVTFIKITVLVLLTQPLSLCAVDIERAKESACFKIKNTAPVDMNWMMSQKIWYYPLMSRLDLYAFGADMSGRDAKDLREDELYFDYCPTFEISTGSVVAKGFGRLQKTYGIKHIKRMEIYKFYGEGHEEEAGTCYTTLTDNKSYAVDACCAPDDQMSWGVISSEKTLPEETVKEIYDHVESLGFKREHFTGLRYDHCNEKKDTRNEL